VWLKPGIGKAKKTFNRKAEPQIIIKGSRHQMAGTDFVGIAEKYEELMIGRAQFDAKGKWVLYDTSGKKGIIGFLEHREIFTVNVKQVYHLYIKAETETEGFSVEIVSGINKAAHPAEERIILEGGLDKEIIEPLFRKGLH
jgi:hypothetical protein